MRYKTTEATNILVTFPLGGTITIDVYDLSNDTKVVTTGVMTQVATGIYKFLFKPATAGEYLWIATDTLSTKSGKIVFGGYVDSVLTTSDFIALS